MKKDIEEIKDMKVKYTFSNISKHYNGIFKTVNIDSFIKKYKTKLKIRKKKEIINKLSISEYLDQLYRTKCINFFKEKTSNNNNESKVNPFYNKEEEIGIFSKKYSPPHYVKENIIRVKKINELHKKKSQLILEKTKKCFSLPSIGTYNINYNFIRKHIPSFHFSNIERFHSSYPSIRKKWNNNKLINKRNFCNQIKEENKLKDIQFKNRKQNIKLNSINKNIKRHKSEIIVNESDNFFITLIKKKIQGKKKNMISKSISNQTLYNSKSAININYKKFNLTGFSIKKNLIN